MEPEIVKRDEEHTIQDIYYLENIEQLEALADPIRSRMRFMLEEPKTGAQLARALGISRARAHYHLKVLRDVGLVGFFGEGISHGITEKYYQMVAYNLDFSGLIPRDHPDPMSDEHMLRSITAAVKSITNMLDMSREGLSRLEVREGLGMGFHWVLRSRLTPDQFKAVREDLVALKDQVIDMELKNIRSGEALPLVNCRVTLFLTPTSNNRLNTELENEE